MDTPYDCLVIGGGSAGYAAARTAVGHGLRVAVVDGARELGGLCILRGCMPSKSLIESANRFHSMTRAREFGLRASGLEAHPPEIRERKRALVREFASYREGQLTDGRFDLLRGKAAFVSREAVEVRLHDGGARLVPARSFVIAAGSAIAVPDVPGLREAGFLTSDDVLDADTLPASLVVLGGGPIALELAWYHQALGVPVTVIQRGAHLVRSMDADVADALQSALEASGMVIHTGTQLLGVERAADAGVTVRFLRNGVATEARATALLCALGREPATAGLGLDRAGIAADGKAVRAGPDQATSLSHVFAAGDACGPHEIVHIAIAQGEAAATNAAVHLGVLPASARVAMDYRLKVFAMFTQPELASVGLTEAEARAAAIPVLASAYPFDDHGKSMVMGETRGFVKMLAHAATGEILGASAVGPHASELIHELVVAMEFRATAARFARIPHYHPTLSEIWSYPAEDLAERAGAKPA